METGSKNSQNNKEKNAGGKRISLLNRIWRLFAGNTASLATGSGPLIGLEETKDPAFWKEIIKLGIIALVIVIPFRLYVAQPFVVDGASMYPTFKNGHYLIVDEVTYRFKEPARGSVLVFKYPKDPSKSFIKRVIGLPGEIISLKEGQVTITSSEYPEGLVLDEPYVEMPKSDTLTYTLGSGEYFVMGDNRAQSADSRIWGPLTKKDIIGRPLLRVMPFGFFPGNYPE